MSRPTDGSPNPSNSPAHRLLKGLATGAVLGVAAVGLLVGPGLWAARKPTILAIQSAPASIPTHSPVSAEFGDTEPSAEARQVADWVASSADNRDRDFAIIDKRHATLFVFDKTARLRAATPILVGAAVGDDSFPGVGNKPVSQVKPFERTTPAGRFDTEPGRNAQGEDVVWVDYEAAVSMHRLRAIDASERRRERIASPTADDNRISYGCVNVPQAFYEKYVKPAFGTRRGVVYVLPDVKPMRDVFGPALAA